MKPGSHQLNYAVKALRWLPAGTPGKARLARRMLGSCLEAQDTIVYGRDGMRYVVPSLREPVGFYLLVDGVYEVQAIDFILRQLKPGGVFVDVGASIGTFTLPAARKVGSRGYVIAVEPSPRIFPYLEQNITLNELKNVRLVRCAATNSDGETAPFYEAPVEKFGMGSLGAQFHNFPVPVLCRTVDHILYEHQIDAVDVMKVDVEGFEATVFEGAEKLLASDEAPLILFEFCDWAETRLPGGSVGDAQRLLRRWGYQIWRLPKFVHDSRPLENIVTTGFEMLVASKALKVSKG